MKKKILAAAITILVLFLLYGGFVCAQYRTIYYSGIGTKPWIVLETVETEDEVTYVSLGFSFHYYYNLWERETGTQEDGTEVTYTYMLGSDSAGYFEFLFWEKLIWTLLV